MIKGLPQWRCHKVVGAFKITRIEPIQVGPIYRYRLHGWPTTDNSINEYVEVGLMFFRAKTSDNARELTVPDEYVGGYLVQYEDGYLSWSPAEAFEKGYSRIGPVDVSASA